MLNFRQKVWYPSLLYYYVEWSIFSTIMPCMLQAMVELTSLILYRRSSLVNSPSHNSLILRKTRYRKNAEKGANQMNLEIDKIGYAIKTFKLMMNQKMTQNKL